MTSRSRRSRWLVLFGVLGTSVLVAHCGSSDKDPPDGSGSGGNPGDASGDSAESSPDVPVVPDGSGGAQYHPACGVDPAVCVPDQPLSCAAYGTNDGGASGMGGAGGEGNVSASGAGGQLSGGAAGAAGAESGGASGAPSSLGGAAGDGQGGMPPVASGGAPDSVDGGASGAAGNGGAADTTPEHSCQVVVTSDGPLAQCQPAGSAMVEDPCFTSSECAPGLACVLDDATNIGRCLPFCCGGDSSCTQGNYCDERRLANDAGSVLEVPVCVPASPCSLAEPYPCDAGSCTCDDPARACLVVRTDGTTTCAEPGMGKVGDPCPCAWGHVCSATGQCVLLCETARAEHYCGNAKCQASAELPEGWGVCVGAVPDASR